MDSSVDYRFEDFTEAEYRGLLRQVKEGWPLISYAEASSAEQGALWRHDIDMSVQRAYRLACMEHEEGIVATYFIHLHNQFYHWHEKVAFQLLEKIRDLGHHLALHFDPAFYDLQRGEESRLEAMCHLERGFLESALDVEIGAVSFHNPAMGGWDQHEVRSIAGMINTYGTMFKKEWAYCSDSNGYWRFRRMKEFLADTSQQKIQVLTHPAWWLPEIASPRERVTRCIEGRATWTHEFYDQLLQSGGRSNVGAPDSSKQFTIAR